jgi:hypothetical protein
MQATAPAPAPSFGSIRKYDEALGYFERPGRDAALKAIYARAMAAPVRSDSRGVSTLDSIAPLPTTDQPKKSRKDAAKKSNPRRRQLMAGALLLVCAGGVGYARIAGIAPQNRQVSAIAQKASDTVGAAMVSGLSAVTERAGLGRLVSTDAADVQRSAAPVTPPAKRSRVKPAGAVLNPTVAPFEAFDLDPLFPSVAEAISAASDPTEMPEDVQPASVGDDEVRIYSAESEEVSPPVGVRPQLPTELPSNVNVEQLSRIDLIVSPAGTVESVKLVGTPHNVHDSMLLSAAKAWTFQPALKHGRPVRYRKTVWVALQQ